MKKKYCHGCYYDLYNHRINFDDKAGCWNFEDAKLVLKKEVPIDMLPKYYHTIKFKRFPNCYSKQRYCYLKKEST